jgi:hypothetical protein
MQHLRHHAGAAVVLAAASLLAGCTTAPAPEQRAAPEQQSSSAAPPYRLTASIREVMNSVIDPNADVVWNAVKTVIERGRPTEHAPANDQEWAEVRRAALIVTEGANLLMMPTRPVAPPGAGSLTPGVELAPEEVRALIDKSPAAWNLFAQGLQNAMAPAMAAIDSKNSQALFEAGEKIDTACENCHQVFWYPNAGASAPTR